MRVAIAGAGDLARYLCEEFIKAGHEIVILSRKHRSHLERLGVTQIITDYTLESLRIPLADCEVLISTIGDLTSSNVHVHCSLLQACQQSPKCKRFIPSEFGGDIESFPDQPSFVYPARKDIRKALQEQTDVEWTLIANGWLADYTVPPQNRYIRDIDELCPINITGGSIVIPGSGREPVDLVWARDVAKALAELVTKPAWEPFTFISGERTCWNDVANIVQQRYGQKMTISHQSLSKIVECARAAKDQDTLLLAEFQLYSLSHASSLPQEKVQAQRDKYFPGIHFRNLQEGLAELDSDSNLIV
ncbi:hypothetical protein CDD81_2030 [Ophiocordyceps australis]|uniref:NmrA-like domain-containing protein n=1 Tax=Ophiocordyceps australis TaxID=1399860 RepID=A0A2C5Y7Y3_9HYPO|nr:hypothetical protein CDD81_2030 [Ophiocordyceps australis]